MATAGSGEPTTAPVPDRWYKLRLGSSFNDDRPSSKFCTLRYEFQPASIDKSQSGFLHKSKENKISVEFQNNQSGKPKVTFEGTSEECRDNDGILFFDGQTFRLERLHRAVKRLRHVRQPGESAVAASSPAPAAVISSSSAPLGTESRSPPLSKTSQSQPLSKSLVHPLPLEVERIDIGESDGPAPKSFEKLMPLNPADQEEAAGLSEDEIADVDLSDDDRQQGPNAAEVLRAQTIGGGSGGDRVMSSSSGSSGSGSSDSDSDDNSSSSAADEEIDIDGDI